MKKLIGASWFLIAFIIGTLLALGLDPFARMIPWNAEKKLAHWLNQDSLSNQCRHNSEAQIILENLILRIYPLDQSDKKFSINVQIVKDDEVNAYTTLGGQIRINSALLEKANSAEELAAVLAHEIAHVQNPHIMESAVRYFFTKEGLSLIFGYNSSAKSLIKYFSNITFSVTKENQADHDALKRLQKAHVNNQGMKDFFTRNKQENALTNFLSDHPTDRSRIEIIKKFSNENTYPVLSNHQWKILQHYCIADKGL